jgi:Protein of unknown function (DUF1439)
MTDPRRDFLCSVALLTTAALMSGCTALNTARALLSNQVSVSEPQLQHYLDSHYPRRYEPLGGLVTLSVMNPEIVLPQSSTRLHLDFDVGIDGLGMRSDRAAGHVAVTSGLRYDTRDNALYLEEPELESAELPLIGDRMNATGRELINDWLRDYARNEPVYRLERNAIEQLGSHRIAGTLIQHGRIVIKLD